ncbi:MAG: DegV family protein, partial [Asgard group archaeon]|nr:DegV family protein [Asgard group archaeon]
EDNNFSSKTSQPSPQQYLQAYKELAEEDCSDIIVITISSGLSGTYNSARIAAKNFKMMNSNIDIHIVDSRNASYSEVFLLEKGFELHEKGLSAGEIAEKLRLCRKHIKTYLYLPTLKYLHRGGRISIAKYLLARLLGKKALVRTTEDGTIESYKTINNHEAGLEAVFESVINSYDYKPQKLAIVHANAEDFATQLEQIIKAKWPNVELRRVLTGTTIASHTGPSSVALIADFN